MGRYAVQSDKYPGEARAYYIIDRGAETPTERRYIATLPIKPSISSDFGKQGSPYRHQVGERFYDFRRDANRECRRLNEAWKQEVKAWLKNERKAKGGS